jgi:hypothetical protein
VGCSSAAASQVVFDMGTGYWRAGASGNRVETMPAVQSIGSLTTGTTLLETERESEKTNAHTEKNNTNVKK